MRLHFVLLAFFTAGLLIYGACESSNPPGQPSAPPTQAPGQASCAFVDAGFGPEGKTPVRSEAVVTGLEVPWAVAILPGGTDWLVSERPGRVRLIRAGSLVASPVATLSTAEGGEGGLLGLALDPEFASNAYFYVYYTTAKAGGNVNRIQRYILSANHESAVADKVLLDDIPAGSFHNGGVLKFGPDGFLYAGTGDARQPDLSRNPDSPNGKILRIDRDGKIPSDNPEPGKPWFIKGVRNVEALDWLDASTVILADHGPTGELGRGGGDEVNIAKKGEDLGWPTIWHCETAPDLVTPVLSWVLAVPPGGGLLYRGADIPQWTGSFIIGVLGAEHLHRVILSSDGSRSISSHEVYFSGTQSLGRLRDVFAGPAGELYVTTSNCDSRGACAATQDGIYRIRL